MEQHQKKVVLIGPAHPLRGGLATYNERLIREYRSMGADASIYTFSLQYPSVLFPGKTQYSSEPPPADIPIHIRVNSVNPLNWLKVGHEIRRMRPDLVIVKFWIPFMAPCLGTICRIIRKNRHTRVVSIIDNIIPHEKRPGDRALAAYWTNSVDGFVAMSRSVLEDLRTFDTKKPKVFCPHPLYDNFGEPVPKPEAQHRLGLDDSYRYLLFFGFIRDYKGLDLLIDAFADERLRKTPLKLIVAGEFYCDPKPYLERIERYGIGEHVIMSNDFIPDSQVVNYFCASDLVVQPYKSATQSGVTQIAYHFNKPMLITNVGGLAEIVPDGKVGYVVPPDPRAIADAIVDFYEERREQEFSANAAIEKQKYTWSKMVEAVDRVMSEE
jgi:glycosyltransferase involved in cell wall biosynthesis